MCIPSYRAKNRLLSFRNFLRILGSTIQKFHAKGGWDSELALLQRRFFGPVIFNLYRLCLEYLFKIVWDIELTIRGSLREIPTKNWELVEASKKKRYENTRRKEKRKLCERIEKWKEMESGNVYRICGWEGSDHDETRLDAHRKERTRPGALSQYTMVWEIIVVTFEKRDQVMYLFFLLCRNRRKTETSSMYSSKLLALWASDKLRFWGIFLTFLIYAMVIGVYSALMNKHILVMNTL